MEIEIQINPSW